MLATHEARRGGYDEAILLTDDGFIADGSGENVFIVRDGTIYTPDLSASILPGITRDTIIQIAQDLGYTVVEKQLIRTDLYLADEVFMPGTAAEVTPLREVHDLFGTVAEGNAVVIQQELAARGVQIKLRTLQRAVASLRQQRRAEALATVRFETPPPAPSIPWEVDPLRHVTSEGLKRQFEERLQARRRRSLSGR